MFGFWAIVLVCSMALLSGGPAALAYAESRNYTEPLFVFVVMVIAASRPVLWAVSALTRQLAQRAPLSTPVAMAWLGLAAVPLLGSVVTEPAAMTIAALMLAPLASARGAGHAQVPGAGRAVRQRLDRRHAHRLCRAPVLMVATTWQWDSAFMLQHFGWKAALAVCFNATLATLALRAHLGGAADEGESAQQAVPLPVVAVHIALLAGVVLSAHHPVIFLGLFLMFMGYTQAYARHQSPLILKEALLVAFFLAGLVVLGGMQQWWLQPIVAGLEPLALFAGALGLTAVTDNAALTYLGSLIAGLSEESRYMLVAGAVAGGGLTVIANAPNPAGVALLKRGFTDETVSAGGLLLGAALPTAIAAAAFLLL